VQGFKAFDHTRAIFPVSYAKPLGISREYPAGSFSGFDYIVDHGRKVVFRGRFDGIPFQKTCNKGCSLRVYIGEKTPAIHGTEIIGL
jgi:hypothetical protein